MDGADGLARVCERMLLLLIGGRVVLAGWPVVLCVVGVVMVIGRVALAFVSSWRGIARGRRNSLCSTRTFRSMVGPMFDGFLLQRGVKAHVGSPTAHMGAYFECR